MGQGRSHDRERTNEGWHVMCVSSGLTASGTNLNKEGEVRESTLNDVNHSARTAFSKSRTKAHNVRSRQFFSFHAVAE